MYKKNKVLVLGIGNDILMDDGIGPKIVNDLKRHYDGSDECDYENIFIGGMGILEFIQGYQTVIIFDAIKTMGGIAGDIYQFTPSDFKETLHLSSFHDTSFLTALRFGDKLGFEIPKNIHIIAIEILEDRTFGNEFTEPLQKRYDEILSKSKNILEGLVKQQVK